jgi:F-type H+-transporting ATPase subunit delta
VVKQGREQFLLFMLHSFIQLYQQKNGIADVLLTTAAPIGKSIEKEIGELVRKNADCRSVQVETNVDERLIGGFVLRIADRQMDSSVATQLAQLERTLLGAL